MGLNFDVSLVGTSKHQRIDLMRVPSGLTYLHPECVINVLIDTTGCLVVSIKHKRGGVSFKAPFPNIPAVVL